MKEFTEWIKLDETELLSVDKSWVIIGGTFESLFVDDEPDGDDVVYKWVVVAIDGGVDMVVVVVVRRFDWAFVDEDVDSDNVGLYWLVLVEAWYIIEYGSFVKSWMPIVLNL